MAITRIKTWITGEVLTAGDLNSEFDNYINNALSLISPLTGNLDFGTTRLLTAGPLVVHVSPEDARTATIDVAAELRSTTSGTPAADIGTGLLFSAESADENPSEVGRLDFAFSDITAASEDSYADLLLRVAGSALETKYRFASTAGAGFQGTFTHAATADRTWTLPNTTGTIALTSDVTSVPIDDGTAIVKGSGDATKLLRFEVDGFTTATTRVLTPPNANITIAGTSGSNHGDSSAVHGLGTSVNVLGNRAASGEFVQRSSFDPDLTASAESIYDAANTVTFAVAYSSTPFVMGGGGTGGGSNATFSTSITTTNFSAKTWTKGAGGDLTYQSYVALGA